MEYLGYRLSLEGLTMFPDKITTIANWPEPCKVKDIQSFLGFANFYCWFIFNYSNITVPLTQLTRKDAPWNFSDTTDHKNLEYFSTSKVLTCQQAQWSEFLSSFNLVIRFHPGKLGAKPDALTR